MARSATYSSESKRQHQRRIADTIILNIKSETAKRSSPPTEHKATVVPSTAMWRSRRIAKMETLSLDQLVRKILIRRITDVHEEFGPSLESLSIAAMLSLLFLILGSYGSVGDYSSTFYALKEMVGQEGLYNKPVKPSEQVVH
jgi:hypothetical protein